MAKFRSVAEYAAAQGIHFSTSLPVPRPSSAPRQRAGATPTSSPRHRPVNPETTRDLDETNAVRPEEDEEGYPPAPPSPSPSPPPSVGNNPKMSSAADALPAAAERASIVRQARPIGGSYCIISVNDTPDSVVITAYDSEACVERQLTLSYEEVSARVAQEVTSSLGEKEKRNVYGRLLSHVVFDAGPNGSHELSLTQAASGGSSSTPVKRGGRGKERNPEDYDTVDDILFNRTGEESEELSESQLMTPQTPAEARSGFLNDHHPPASPIVNPNKQRPNSQRQRRRRPKTTSSLRGSKSTGKLSKTQPLPRINSSRSRPGTSRTSSREIAGYKPPTDLSHLNEELLERAKGLRDNDKELGAMMKKEVFKLAANRVGVDTESLRPRTTMSFRTGPTPMAKLKLMHQHYDNRRVLNIALVLMEMQKADDLLRQRDKVQEDYIKTISSGFFDTLKRERRRIRGIKNNRRKIEVVAENENKRLIQSRQEFNERMARAQKRHEELARMRAQQKEYLARRSAERQQEIMRVQVQKEEREAARLKAIQDSHNARNEVLEKHRKAQEEARIAKEKRLADRELQRQRKREDVKQAQRLRRDMLSQHLSEKSKASAKIKAKRKAEVEARRAERWLVAQSRQENAERVRREKEFHQKQVMQKIHQAYKMMDHMKELRAAVVEERKKVKRQMIIEVDEWKDKTTLQRNITPGPGEYESHRKLPGPSGGTWGKYAPKSDLEWIIYRASQLPGPGQYEDVDQTKLVTGGTWGKYAPKSDVEWQIYRASQIPGPGDYEPAEVPSGAAVTFGEFDPKSDLDVLIARASQLPGPSDYAPPMPPIKKPSIKAMRSKLRKAAEKVKMANTFISMAKGAARDRRASMAKGVRVPFTVKSSDVRQTQRMLDAHDARREAEDAAERGDVQGAKRAADKATLAAQSAQRAAMGTGGQVGVVQNPQAVAAARSASSAAKAARRASLTAADSAAMAAAAAAVAAASPDESSEAKNEEEGDE